MEPGVPHVGGRQEGLPVQPVAPRVDGAAVRLGEHKAMLLPTLLGRSPLTVLPLAVRDEQLTQRLGQHDHAP